jgi:UDP-2,3-diacylglucosamine pyrophosphatase LpxH
MRYFFSDLHLGHKYCDVNGIESVIGKFKAGDKVAVNGDFFDLQYMPLLDIVRANFEIVHNIYPHLDYYVPGNHDFEFSKLNGIEMLIPQIIYPETILTFDGMKVLVVHGHLFGYFAWYFKTVERFYDVKGFRKFSKWMAKNSILSLCARGERCSFGMKEDVIKYATMRGFDAVVCGHSHAPEIVHMPNGLIYLNPGSALFRFTYITWDGTRFELKEAK